MRVCGLFLAGCVMIGQAHAAPGIAMLETVEGDVFINAGAGFEVAKGEMSLAEGDTLLVKENSGVVLNFASSGCFQSMREPGLYVIKNQPCVPGESRVVTSNLTASTAPQIAALAPGATIATPALPSGTVMASLGIAGAIGAAFVASTFLLSDPVSAD
jgi:hypothetical protein